MTRDEWKRRYADRIKQRAEWDEEAAMEAAEAGALFWEQCERTAGNAVRWADENPEDAADDEMSYWDDDGE